MLLLEDTVGLMSCKHMLPAHIHFFSHKYSQVLCRAALNTLIDPSVLVLGHVLTQVQDLALLGLANFMRLA